MSCCFHKASRAIQKPPCRREEQVRNPPSSDAVAGNVRLRTTVVKRALGMLR
ncbi:hypothetical protein BaRGS_00008691, partial [Batillaria attramentaria]